MSGGKWQSLIRKETQILIKTEIGNGDGQYGTE